MECLRVLEPAPIMRECSRGVSGVSRSGTGRETHFRCRVVFKLISRFLCLCFSRTSTKRLKDYDFVFVSDSSI